MKKTKRKWSGDSFYDYLFDAVPHFEDKLMRDYNPGKQRKPHLNLLPVDIRLLPNLQRRVYCASGRGEERVKGVKMTRREFWRVVQKAEDSLMPRLRVWLKSLPPDKRKIEKSRRWFSNSWIGHVELGELDKPDLRGCWAEVKPRQ